MRSRCTLVMLTVIATGLLLLVSIAAMAGEHHSDVIKVGKKGEVTFSKETKVGDLTLKPGRYVVQHRVQGEEHFVHFVSQSGSAHGGEVKCNLEPLKNKASQTAVTTEAEGAMQRIVRIEIAGENVAHVFTP
jgi:hypothetical protein